MFLKSQNGDTLRKLSEGDQSITHVHFAAPFNYRVLYDVTDDLNRFLQLFSKETTISTLKLSDLRMNKDQIITLSRGIKDSLRLQKLVLKKIIRANGGFWYIADSIRQSVSITHVVFEEFKMRPRNFSMITDIILGNEHIITLTIIKCTMFIRCIDSFEIYLGYNSSLTSLRLSNVSIDDIILARLLKMINIRNRLSRLEVDHNNITCNDDALIALMELNTSITYLNLSHNTISNEGIVALAGVVNKNKTLRHLNISGNGYIGNIGLLIKNLRANTSLQRLSLARQYFDDDELTALGDLFSRYHQFTRLSLRGSWLHGGRLSLLCKSLRADSHLTRVNLSGVCRNDSALESLATWLKTNHSLMHLTLRNNDITSSNISTLCSALEVNNTLTYLDLGENYIGRLGAEKLASSITGNHSLIQLKLAQNFIGGEGVRIFLFVLRCNVNLKKLNIRDNAYCAEGINYAIQLLEENPDLTLTMYDQHLQSLEGIQYLQRALINNPKVNQLNYKCKAGKTTLLTFGHPGATALSEALFNNNCLTRLTIYAGNLGDAGMLELVAALQENRTLEELAFAQCNILPEGVEVLCTWLKMNTRVKKLNLENNGYLSVASEHFADLLTGNPYLIELNIAKCDFKEPALRLIFAALKFNTTLRKLDISEYSPLETEYCSFINNTFLINQTLTHLNICPSFSFLSETSHDVLELQLYCNYSLVCCRFSRYAGDPLESLIRNRSNKKKSLLLLKEYAIIQDILEDKKSEAGFHLLFRIPKDVFYLILSYLYPAYTQTICNQKYLNYRASYQGMLNPATFFNPHSASDHITDKKKRQKIDTAQMHL